MFVPVLQWLQHGRVHLDVLCLHLHRDVPFHHHHPFYLVLPGNNNTILLPKILEYKSLLAAQLVHQGQDYQLLPIPYMVIASQYYYSNTYRRSHRTLRARVATYSSSSLGSSLSWCSSITICSLVMSMLLRAADGDHVTHSNTLIARKSISSICTRCSLQAHYVTIVTHQCSSLLELLEVQGYHGHLEDPVDRMCQSDIKHNISLLLVLSVHQHQELHPHQDHPIQYTSTSALAATSTSSHFHHLLQ